MLDDNLAVGVEQVAVGGARAEVGPLADPTIAQVAIMRFVGETLENCAADFTGDFALRADGGVGFDDGAVEHGGARADDCGADDGAAGADDGVACDVDAAGFAIKYGAGIDLGRRGDGEGSHTDDGAGGHGLDVFLGVLEHCQIGTDGGITEVPDVPRATDEGGAGHCLGEKAGRAATGDGGQECLAIFGINHCGDDVRGVFLEQSCTDGEMAEQRPGQDAAGIDEQDRPSGGDSALGNVVYG